MYSTFNNKLTDLGTCADCIYSNLTCISLIFVVILSGTIYSEKVSLHSALYSEVYYNKRSELKRLKHSIRV